MKSISVKIQKLIENASCSLPSDIENSLKSALKKEKSALGKKILKEILGNAKIARNEKVPICQDTGSPVFFVIYNPKKHSENFLGKEIFKAVNAATKKGILRPNSVAVISEKNIGNSPEIYFSQGKKLKIELLLKGGGSENCTKIYSLPDTSLNATRNFEGVKKCAVDAVKKVQGNGCPPYVLGIAIGGSASSAMLSAKKQLLRKINDKNRDKKLSALEKEILHEINGLGIGPMGLGGEKTALAAKISTLDRHPATYFVAVSFGCWCNRRASLEN